MTLVAARCGGPRLDVVERARRYIAKCPPAVSGQGGHNATFHVASVLVHGFALGETDALRLLQEWNGSCSPPWSEAALVYKIKSAGNAMQREPRGYLLEDAPPRASNQKLKIPPKPVFQPETLKRISARTSF